MEQLLGHLERRRQGKQADQHDADVEYSAGELQPIEGETLVSGDLVGADEGQKQADRGADDAFDAVLSQQQRE